MPHRSPPDWLVMLAFRLGTLLIIIGSIMMIFYLPHLIDLPPNSPFRELNALAPSSF